jgi:hypothetical protein
LNERIDGQQSIDNDHMITIGIDQLMLVDVRKRKEKQKRVLDKKDGILSFSSRSPRNLRRLLKVHTLARATGTMRLHPCQPRVQAASANGAVAVGWLCALWPPQGLQSEAFTVYE